jgi:gluconate 5-dehydrogenase
MTGEDEVANVRQLFDLTGRVAIVTGGSIGLGRQMAEALAEMGVSVVLSARKKERCEEAARELRQLGVRTLAVGCNVSDPQDVQKMVQSTLDEFGAIDILVNSAGTSWASPAEEMTLVNWQKVIDTNLTGTFLCCQAVGKVMIGQQRGRIINVASIGAYGGSPQELMATPGYTASKGAVITLTKDLACEWAGHNVQVNAIAPGFFPTHMSGGLIEMKREVMLRDIPMRRFGGDDELKGAVVYLASQASSYVTGHVLVVDGGQTAQV